MLKKIHNFVIIYLILYSILLSVLFDREILGEFYHIMSKEIWDIFNENGVLTGKTAVRGRSFLKPGEYHLVVHIWVVSPDGKFLIQRRSERKKLMPGEWAATGGAAISGESSFTAARRELFEELGIKSNEDTLKQIFHLKRRNSFLDAWLIVANPEIDSLKLQESEVAEAKWVDADELKKMIKLGRFHNYGKEYFQKLFESTDILEGAVL